MVVDFSIDEAARLARLSVKTVHNWDIRDVMRASIPAPCRGVCRRYTFADVVALRVASMMLDVGATPKAVRPMTKYLRTRAPVLAASDRLEPTYLIMTGPTVFEVEGATSLGEFFGRESTAPGGACLLVPLHTAITDVQHRMRQPARTHPVKRRTTAAAA